MNENKKYINIENLYFFIIACLPVFFLFQGLDFTDMGYNLVSSRDMINDPENVANYGTFLSMFLGGLWIKFSTPWGLFGAKFGVVIVYWCIFAASYMILKDFMQPSQVAVGLCVTFLFSIWTFWISYNDITSLFSCLSLAFLYLGFKSQKNRFFLLSGIMCALCLFSRIPNILMFGFGFLPLITRVVFNSKINDRKTFKNTGCFFIGYFGMILICCVILYFSDYGVGYLDSLLRILHMLSSKNSLYSSTSLFKRFIDDHERVLSIGVIVFLLGTGLSILLSHCRKLTFVVVPLLTAFSFFIGWKYYKTTFLTNPFLFWVALLSGIYQILLIFFSKHPVCSVNKNEKCKKAILLFFICLVVLAVMVYPLRQQRIRVYDPIFGLIYISLFIEMLTVRKQRKENAFFGLLMALSMFFTVPLGSGDGIRNATFGLWLSLPLTLNIIKEYHKKCYGVFPAHENSKKMFIESSVIVLLALSIALSFRYTYRDSDNRFQMRYCVDHPKLRGIYTTKERAEVVQGVLDELEKYVKPGDYMLGYHTVSTLYFITDTRPYLYSSWPFLYEPSTLRYFLEKANNERPGNPVVVRSKFSLQNFDWPKNKYQNKSASYIENRDIIEQFLQRKGYQKVWENEIFEIMRVR